LLLYCFLSYGPTQSYDGRLEIGSHLPWTRLAKLCQGIHPEKQAPSNAESATTGSIDVYERFLLSGDLHFRVAGFMDGRDSDMDIISLVSTSTRLCRRCTPWGIGEALGDILARINV